MITNWLRIQSPMFSTSVLTTFLLLWWNILAKGMWERKGWFWLKFLEAWRSSYQGRNGDGHRKHCSRNGNLASYTFCCSQEAHRKNRKWTEYKSSKPVSSSINSSTIPHLPTTNFRLSVQRYDLIGAFLTQGIASLGKIRWYFFS